jgi:hypothetical protein
MTDLRPISTEGFGAISAPPSFGAVPDLRWIDVSLLSVDPAYQREIRADGARNVRRIAEGFEWVKFSPVIVSPVPGGRFAVIDGQHRATAAALLGITSVPCQVVVADQDTQARAFVAINAGTTRVLKLQIFAARVAAGEPEAVAITAAARAGVKLLRSAKAKQYQRPGETMAVGAVETIFRAGGRELLIVTLRAIRAATGDAGGAIDAAYIRAVGVVLHDHPEWAKSTRLIDAMEEIDLEDALIEARATALRKRGVTPQDLLQARIIEHLTAMLSSKEAA